MGITKKTAAHPNPALSGRWAIPGIFALLVFGYPFVAFWDPIIGGVGNRLLSVLMRGALLLLSLHVLWTVGIKKRRLCNGWYLTFFLAFWGLYIIRMLLDVVYVPQQLGRPGYEYFLFGLGGALIPALALHVKLETRHLNRAFLWMLGIASVACIGNLLALREVIASGDVTRIEHETLNPISLGHLGASLTILASYGILRPDVLDRWQGRLLLPVFFGIGLVCVGLGTSRGPMLALACAFIALLLVRAERKKKKLGRIIVLALLVVGAGLGAVWHFGDIVNAFVLRFQGAQQLTDNSSVARIEMWSRAWGQFVNNPVLGDALVERERLQYPHNLVIESFMATGIFGGILCLVLLVQASVSSLRLLRQRPAVAWVALLAIQHMVGAMFSGGIWGQGSMWGMMAATVALVKYHPQ